jgi:RNA polymerase-binding protein DksA
VDRPKAKAAPKAKGKAKTLQSTESVKTASLPAAKPPSPPKSPPRKPAVDEEMLKQLRDAMIHQRQRMLSVVRSTQAQLAEKTKDLPDVSDQASEGYGDELAVGLMAIEAAQLDDIEAALQRIDAGTYGLCLECGKPIPRKRLEVLPFVCRCLTCEGARELRVRAQAMYEDEEES